MPCTSRTCTPLHRRGGGTRAPRPWPQCHSYRVELLLALFATGLFGTTGFVWWRAAPRRTRRVLRKTRVTPIAELVDGQLACIVGRVEPEAAPIESLIARKKCVAFDTTTNVFDGVLFTSPVRIETT